jgi:hypothetical protein
MANEAWMAALRATSNNPEAQAIVAEIIRQAQAAETVRGHIPKRRTIYLEPDATPKEVFNVDAREWIRSGKAREVVWVPGPEAAEVAETAEVAEAAPEAASVAAPAPEETAEPEETVEEVAPAELDELTKAQLRERWKTEHPGQRVPPRAGKDWFLAELRG